MPYTSLLHNSSQATASNLSMTAAGRRKTDTTRRVAVSAETSAEASDAPYVPTVVEKAEDVQVPVVHHTKACSCPMPNACPITCRRRSAPVSGPTRSLSRSRRIFCRRSSTQWPSRSTRRAAW